MSFSISWIAVKGCDENQAAEALGLEPDEGASRKAFKILVGTLPKGWTIVWSENFEDLQKGRFQPLLSFGPAVACALSEIVMFQEARGYLDGAEAWRVTHDSSEGIYHLDVGGSPPPEFESIKRKAVKAQDAEGGEDADVDLIADVPLELAKTICGFKHDGAWPEGLSFVTLRKPRKRAGDGRPGLLARLFGRG